MEDEEQDAELSHPQSAEMVEELEESIWSVVRQKNERTYTCIPRERCTGYRPIGKTSTGVRGRDICIEEGTGK